VGGEERGGVFVFEGDAGGEEIGSEVRERSEGAGEKIVRPREESCVGMRE